VADAVAEKFEVTTTAQVERTYVVEADDEEQAKKRLRTFIADADAVREGVVTKLDQEVNTTPERIKRAGAWNGQEVAATPEEPPEE
jgi:hypothetical protein